MTKTQTWLTWLSLSAVSPVALAVGLGAANVNSFLGAPLSADIPVLESSQYAAEEVQVSVANEADFTAAGLEWSPLVASVRAQVIEQEGRRLVHLSSNQPMQAPWLDVLLMLDVPGGQQFRDITLLFDPQGYSPNQAHSIASGPLATGSAVTPSATHSSSAASSAYVSQGDTLWVVANRVKPSQASVQQAMVALLEANPEAFPSGNINAMRANQALRVPSEERILALSHLEADASIEAMNDAWRERRSGSLQTDALPEAVVNPAAVMDSQRLAATDDNAPGNTPDSVLSAGDLQVDITGLELANEPVRLNSENNAPEALSRIALTEQLRLSQTMIKQVIEERDLMRSEVTELRNEVTLLAQTLSETLAVQQQSAEPLMASMDEADRPGIAALLGRYQWPLALAAIALLAALLMVLRKRRAGVWEEATSADPVIRPVASPNVTPAPTANKANSDPHDVKTDVGATGVGATEVGATEFSTKEVSAKDVDATNVEDANVDTQHVEAASRGAALELRPETGTDEEEEQAQGPVSPAAETPLLSGEETQPVEQDDHHFIDYHPPPLTSQMTANGERPMATPMQPSIEFPAGQSATSAEATKEAQPEREEEWDIEEVAFKPRGLDNG